MIRVFRALGHQPFIVPYFFLLDVLVMAILTERAQRVIEAAEAATLI